jgi:hypothetical protein
LSLAFTAASLTNFRNLNCRKEGEREGGRRERGGGEREEIGKKGRVEEGEEDGCREEDDGHREEGGKEEGEEGREIMVRP